MDIDKIVRDQFRLDTNCSEESPIGVNINKRVKHKGARYFEEISDFFRAIVYRGTLYMMCDEKIYDWALEYYGDRAPEWFCKFSNLRILEGKLAEQGYGILDTHVYFLPDQEYEGYEFNCPYEIRWYDREEILNIKGNPFRNALMYYKDCPDEMSVAALNKDGEPVAMAGVSSDSEKLWQIGIDVLPEYRHRGLALYLVTLLKEKVLEEGRVPFYGTSESHSLSQRVAVRSGFIPSWCEIYCKKISTEN